MRFNVIQKLLGRPQSSATRPARRPRLRLEALEDRLAPATLTVGSGEKYATINAALTAAKAGDTIDVYPGTYTEQLTVTKNNIMLTGITVNSSTPTIQSPANVTPVTLGSDNIGAALIDITASGDTVTGFQINGATDSDGQLYSGIRVRSGGSATISSNTITGLITANNSLYGIGIQIGTNRGSGSGATATVSSNTITNYFGAGILVDGSASSATISSNIITGRGAANGGVPEYGVQVSRGATANVQSNTISGNSNGNNSGGIYFYQDGGTNSIAQSNTVSGNDVGIWLDTSSATKAGKIQVVSNSVTGNTGFAGILDQSSNGVVIQTNTVANNNTSNGIALSNASNVQVVNNSVTNNASDGIYDYEGTNNQITGNTSANNNGNGILLDTTTGDTISSNSLTNNTGAGLYLHGCTNITIDSNSISNNKGGGIVQN